MQFVEKYPDYIRMCFCPKEILINDLPYSLYSPLATEWLKLPIEFHTHLELLVGPAYKWGELEQWFSWTKEHSICPCCCCVWSDLASDARYYPLPCLGQKPSLPQQSQTLGPD